MTTRYIYRDAAGAYLGDITRNVGADGKKKFIASRGFPNPRPLYGLDRLAQRPDAPVLVVEGEKVADAAGVIFPSHICVTSPFGALSAAKADWTPLHGRTVTIWPDADAAGAKYAVDVVLLVSGAKVVPVPASFPDGWDLADALPSGITPDALSALLLLAEVPKVKAKKPNKDDLRKTAEEAKRERDGVIAKIRALISKTVANGATEAEADSAFNKARQLMEEHSIKEEELRESVDEPEPTFDDLGADIDGDALLDDVHKFLLRFVSYPSRHASVAHALWIAHAHMMSVWDSSPRIAFMSPERGSGKTRALEVTALLVPRPLHSVNNSVAFVIRKIADETGAPTILYDEVDALFGNKQPEKAELLSILNAGHRKGATSGRCVTGAGPVRTEELPAYCAVALAGLRGLPDTIGSRSIRIEMRRRTPDEPVEPFRERIHKHEARPIFDELELWCTSAAKRIATKMTGKYENVPAEISDRDEDCWEALLAIADDAGGDWPELARHAAVDLVRQGRELSLTSGVELLQHILEAFGEQDRIWTDELLKHLHNRDESPWREEGRKPELSDRGLAKLLKPYQIRSKQVRIGEFSKKGYLADDFADAWERYLSPAQAERNKRNKRNIIDNNNNNVSDVSDVSLRSGNGACPACDGLGCPTCHPENYGMKPRPPAGYGKGGMQ